MFACPHPVNNNTCQDAMEPPIQVDVLNIKVELWPIKALRESETKRNQPKLHPETSESDAYPAGCKQKSLPKALDKFITSTQLENN